MPALGGFIMGLVGFGAPAIGSAAFGGWAAGAAFGSTILGSITARLLGSVAFSALARALAPKPKLPGLTNEATQTGGTDPQSFIVGHYATGGQLVAPPMTHGNVGKTPNAYLTYVIAVSDVPGVTLSRLFIDGEVAVIGGIAHPDYGTPVEIKGTAGRVWVKWYDGTQTVADPMLLAKYGTHPERPWLADMVGIGTAYAILTFRFDRNLFKNFPKVRFEVDGIPLYDPRKDPSVGGIGTHDWSDPSTWEQTDNAAIIKYNALLGIPIPGGDIWGGEWKEDGIPIADWFAAMNACDEAIALSAGGTEPRFRAGMEITVDQEPADAIEEFMKTCTGRMADVGGTMKVAVGAPGAPVKAITDDDIIITDEQTASLFPSLAQTHNGVHATFPDPASLWESRDAPPRYDATAETADGRRLIATVSLPACPYGDQVQRLMQAWINEERRFRRHQIVLPPDYMILEPLDVISWTSARNGYSAKLFEVVEIVHDPVSLLQACSLREVDPADYDWDTSLEVPWVAPTPGTSLTPPQGVPSFAAAGIALDDTNGDPRRPAIILTWDGTDLDDVSALEYELRLQGGVQVVSGATLSVPSGSLVISAGIIPDTAYEVRARLIAPRPVSWTAWTLATTPGTFIAPTDFGTQIDSWFADAGISVPRLVNTLPPNDGSRVDDEWVYLIPAKKLYRWSAAATDWVSIVDPNDIPDGELDGSKVAYATLVAGLFAAGAVRAGDMTIDDLLRLDALGAGISVGKVSGFDDVNDGVYMGKTNVAGTPQFGFLAGRIKNSGELQRLAFNGIEGFSLLNAAHFVTSSVPTAPVDITTSQILPLGAGVKSFRFDGLGAGGGGASGQNDAARPRQDGAAGEDTVVELYDGASPTGVSWTFPGGPGGAWYTGSNIGWAGEDSAYGTGGAGSTSGTLPGEDATGYGAGGGGGYGAGRGGQGGKKGPNFSIIDYDVSALANPTLVITLGDGGTGGVDLGSTVTGGGKGSPARLTLTIRVASDVPADVVPLVRTFTGSFTKPNNGTDSFPDYGAGFWQLSTAGAGLQLGDIELDAIGTVLKSNPAATSLSFFSAKTPKNLGVFNTSRTIDFIFHAMGNWGGV